MIFLRFISRLSFRTLYRISDVLFFFSYYIVNYRRRVVEKNLKNSFPSKDSAKLKKIEKQFYRNLCDYSVETIKLLTLKKKSLAERMVFKNLEVMEQYKAKQQPVIILTSHHFNWEWLLTAGNFSLPVPVDFVYQPVKNAFFNKFSLICRTRFGAHPIKRNDVARETIRRKKLLRGIAIIADQYPGLKKDKKYLTTFLHQETVFFQGANQLAVLTQYPVVFVAVKKIKRGYYEAMFEKISDPPYSPNDFTILEKYIKAIERVIEKSPSEWLWSHDRWKKRHLNN